MSFQMPAHQHQVLHKTDPNAVQNLHSIRDKVHHICRNHVNQMVRVEMLDGQAFVGRIVGCNGGMVYLRVSNQGGHRPFYDDLILTLVLYELLVITLLYT